LHRDRCREGLGLQDQPGKSTFNFREGTLKGQIRLKSNGIVRTVSDIRHKNREKREVQSRRDTRKRSIIRFRMIEERRMRCSVWLIRGEWPGKSNSFNTHNDGKEKLRGARLKGKARAYSEKLRKKPKSKRGRGRRKGSITCRGGRTSVINSRLGMRS